MVDERTVNIARGRVQVLQSGCRRMVESVDVKLAELDRLEVDVHTTGVRMELERVKSALLDAIDELVGVDAELRHVQGGGERL